jgi:hypothetical protein
MPLYWGWRTLQHCSLLSLNLPDAELIRNETAPDQTIDHTTVIYGGDDGQGADGHRQAVQGSEKAEILAMRRE